MADADEDLVVETTRLTKIYQNRQIALNDVSVSGSGFGTGENEIVLLSRDGGRESLGRASKRELARRMWDALLRVRANSK